MSMPRYFFLNVENEAAGLRADQRKLILRKREEWFGGLKKCIVREAFRSKGIGREFFAYLDKVKGSAVTRMRLEVEEDNTRAVALYKKLGYKPLEYAQMIKDAPLK